MPLGSFPLACDAKLGHSSAELATVLARLRTLSKHKTQPIYRTSQRHRAILQLAQAACRRRH